MRSISLSILSSLILFSCGTNDSDETDTVPTESLIDSRFQECYYENDLAKNKADSALIQVFGEKLFSRYIKLNLDESTMNCQVDDAIELVPFGDSSYCVPNSYDLRYQINEKGNELFTFRLVAGSDMQFEPVSTIVSDQLKGYQQLLSGKFAINYTQAKSIAFEEGVDFNESYLELIRNTEDSLTGNTTFSWEAELEYDHNSVLLLHIDAMTGETGTVTYTIEHIE